MFPTHSTDVPTSSKGIILTDIQGHLDLLSYYLFSCTASLPYGAYSKLRFGFLPQPKQHHVTGEMATRQSLRMDATSQG